jgi:L-asparaginase
VLSLMRKDSLELTEKDREAIRAVVEASDEKHIIITHGTDTMAQTARFLQGIADKVIVFTGSMQPARFHRTDAVFNIASAVTAVQLLPPGAYIAMNGRVLTADEAVKNRAANRFEGRPVAGGQQR